MTDQNRLKIIVENDVFLRLVQVILDPDTDEERRAAFRDFFRHECADLDTWCHGLRKGAPRLAGAQVIMVDDQEALHKHLPECEIAVVESLRIGAEELSLAPGLKIIQKFGRTLRNIDVAAAGQSGVKILTVRRRANIACAEHAFTLMLALARRLPEFTNKTSKSDLEALGFPFQPFDRRHTPSSNWARIPGIRTLYESTIGIVGMGEIGREIAIRAQAFGMRILYTQRTRLPAEEEASLGIEYAALDSLLSSSDWVVPQLPSGPATRSLLNRSNLAGIKKGAVIVNVSRADVVERDAVLSGLRSGQIGGFGLDAQYGAQGDADEELLAFSNVLLTPHIAAQPRQNAMSDFADMINQMNEEI